uniref:BED-type domain-containing protein n=1 Tax=Cacopsylla melanoneura TaxID=428564 RepID=A0A8D8Q8Y0_9HEMI
MSEQKSKTWNYFNKIDKDSAKCTVCEKVISTKGRTSKGLTVHLKTIHKIDPKIQEDEEGIQFAESSRAGTSRAGILSHSQNHQHQSLKVKVDLEESLRKGKSPSTSPPGEG